MTITSYDQTWQLPCSEELGSSCKTCPTMHRSSDLMANCPWAAKWHATGVQECHAAHGGVLIMVNCTVQYGMNNCTIRYGMTNCIIQYGMNNCIIQYGFNNCNSKLTLTIRLLEWIHRVNPPIIMVVSKLWHSPWILLGLVHPPSTAICHGYVTKINHEPFTGSDNQPLIMMYDHLAVNHVNSGQLITLIYHISIIESMQPISNNQQPSNINTSIYHRPSTH